MTQMASLRALAVFIMGSNICIFSQGSLGGGGLWDSTVLCTIKGVLHIYNNTTSRPHTMWSGDFGTDYWVSRRPTNQSNVPSFFLIRARV